MWRERGRRAAFHLVEYVWTRAFAAVSGLSASRPGAVWASGSDVRVLVVATHPDDESLGCGGSIALHGIRGNTVSIAIVTDGSGSTRATPALRASESAAAARTLGGSWRYLGLREYDWSDTVLIEQLVDMIAEIKPTIVYAPSCIDYHPEHIRAAAALAAALTRTHSTACVRVVEIGVPLTPLLANRCVDVSDASSLKAQALAAYRSQRDTIEVIRRLHRYNRSLYGGGVETEVFWEMSVPAYEQLMAHAGDLAAGAFRGVRPRPLGDPFCYLVGLRRRRRLRDDLVRNDAANR